jgi:hypothetical protein
MRCPFHDAQLVKHMLTDPQGRVITYFRCDLCGSHWMDAFNANYISTSDISPIPHPKLHAVLPTCPECKAMLVLLQGENVPDTVHVLHCPKKHGYFFPDNELVSYKEAQEAKINYHKLWRIPLPSVASVLLASVTLVFLSVGIIVSVVETQNAKNTQTQAAQIIVSQQVIPAPDSQAATFVVTTRVPAQVNLRFIKPNDLVHAMTSSDGRTHMITIHNLTRGQYIYMFEVAINNKLVQSEPYTFIMPE